MINTELNINELRSLKLTYENLKIEIIGSWIWLSGKDTFKIKDKLKDLGFFWSKNKKAWFFNGSAKKQNRAYCKNLDEIKKRYLSQEVL